MKISETLKNIWNSNTPWGVPCSNKEIEKNKIDFINAANKFSALRTDPSELKGNIKASIDALEGVASTDECQSLLKGILNTAMRKNAENKDMDCSADMAVDAMILAFQTGLSIGIEMGKEQVKRKE